VGGYYFPGEEPAVDIELIIDRLELQLIEMFAGDELTDMAGIITGKMNVTGNLASPEISGALTFTDAAFRIAQLNSAYILKNEQVSFDRHNVVLRDFTLEDSFGRIASLDGTVNIKDFDNLILNLEFSTRNFLLMDLPERRGEMYHGTLLVDSDLRIRGSHNSPSVGGRLRLNEGSSFSFVIPQTTPEAIGGEGVVEFIVPGEEDFFRKVTEGEWADELRSGIQIMTVNLNVELDRNTELTVVIDEMAGDFLRLRGGGELNFGIDPGGAINLTGRYNITEGEYMLSFHEVARRRFSIREGSGIIFTGDPMEAELDITAIYTVRTSGEQLLRSTGQADHPRSERARRQLPFLVYLNMEGELMAPGISFELDMPPEHRGAFDGSLMARINAINEDESELNKQVFALLILGSFIHESPFAVGGGPGIAATARTSASQILSQQLNRLSDRHIRGVDINFELESYEIDRGDDAIGRTELQVEISRDFFNDRVRVVVGGNIELEDETHRETRPGEIAGDFTLEYLLTPAGNLLLRGFRTREYGDLIEGELTTTGIALVFSRSYTRFRDLFRREAEDEMVPMPGVENHNVTDGSK
jgi:translocation and assembly module TamB